MLHVGMPMLYVQSSTPVTTHHRRWQHMTQHKNICVIFSKFMTSSDLGLWSFEHKINLPVIPDPQILAFYVFVSEWTGMWSRSKRLGLETISSRTKSSTSWSRTDASRVSSRSRSNMSRSRSSRSHLGSRAIASRRDAGRDVLCRRARSILYI